MGKNLEKIAHLLQEKNIFEFAEGFEENWIKKQTEDNRQIENEAEINSQDTYSGDSIITNDGFTELSVGTYTVDESENFKPGIILFEPVSGEGNIICYREDGYQYVYRVDYDESGERRCVSEWDGQITTNVFGHEFLQGDTQFVITGDLVVKVKNM